LSKGAYLDKLAIDEFAEVAHIGEQVVREGHEMEAAGRDFLPTVDTK